MSGSSTPLTIVPTPPLAIIAEGIVRQLKLVFPETQFTHDFVPAKVTIEAWKHLTRRTPFIGLGWQDLHSSNSTMSQLNGTTRWTVYPFNYPQFLRPRLPPGRCLSDATFRAT